MSIRLTFQIGTNVDIAQVQAKIDRNWPSHSCRLKSCGRDAGQKKMSPDLPGRHGHAIGRSRNRMPFLSNFVTLRILDNIRKRLPGVGDASVFGQQNYNMA